MAAQERGVIKQYDKLRYQSKEGEEYINNDFECKNKNEK